MPQGAVRFETLGTRLTTEKGSSKFHFCFPFSCHIENGISTSIFLFRFPTTLDNRILIVIFVFLLSFSFRVFVTFVFYMHRHYWHFLTIDLQTTKDLLGGTKYFYKLFDTVCRELKNL